MCAREGTLQIKGACSEICETLIFHELANYGHVSNQYIIQDVKIANVHLIYKQFEIVMFIMLLIVLWVLVTTFSYFQA